MGMAGTGGASAALGTCCDRAGDEARKVLSDIDELLPLRSSWNPGGPPADPVLPMDEVELVLLKVLLVCTSLTDVGVVGLAFRAAAAAADEREALEARFFKNACAAASEAEGSVLVALRDY